MTLFKRNKKCGRDKTESGGNNKKIIKKIIQQKKNYKQLILD